MTALAVIDSGGANIASVCLAFARLGVAAELTTDHETIGAAERVVLPGVGAAGDVMQRLHERGLADLVPTLRQPVLGICVGMQVLHERSEEDDTTCLGILPGVVRRIPAEPGRSVPHMGWNRLACRAVPLLDGIAQGAHVYFLHSYAVVADEHTIAAAEYGGRFAAAQQRGNFLGVQFHPERSGAVGAQLLENFLALSCT